MKIIRRDPARRSSVSLLTNVARRIGLALTAVLVSESVDAGAPTVRGDSALLTVLKDAQLANQAKFERGHASAEVTEIWKDKGQIDAEVDVLWDARRRHYKYSYVRSHLPDGAVETRDGSQLLHTGKDLFWHNPRAGVHGLAGEVPKTQQQQYRGIWEICPSEVWFRRKDTGRAWAEEFDTVNPPRSLTGIEISADQGLVKVRKTYHVGDALVEKVIVASLDFGGNIVEYHRTGNPNAKEGTFGLAEHATFAWEADARGEFALKKVHLEWLPASETGPPVYVYELKIKQFDANPEISRDRFEFAALKLPVGTYVKRADGRTYRVESADGADTGNELSQEILDDLAEQFQREGFGRSDPVAPE